jgi:hypothetical protein
MPTHIVVFKIKTTEHEQYIPDKFTMRSQIERALEPLYRYHGAVPFEITSLEHKLVKKVK